jgi:hypothetical protein
MKSIAVCLLLTGCVPLYVPRAYRADYRRAHARPSPELRAACLRFERDKVAWDAAQGASNTFDAVYESEARMQALFQSGSP